jgi:hypothetical protein
MMPCSRGASFRQPAAHRRWWRGWRRRTLYRRPGGGRILLCCDLVGTFSRTTARRRGRRVACAPRGPWESSVAHEDARGRAAWPARHRAAQHTGEKRRRARGSMVKRPVRLAYQPPASSTFLSEQTSHQQPANSTLLSEQTSTSHQPPANRTG